MSTISASDESGSVTKLSAQSVEATVLRLTNLLETKGMKVFAVIDQSAEAREVGLDLRETVLVIFGSPVAGTPVMEAAPLAALDLPLKGRFGIEGGTGSLLIAELTATVR